MTASAYVFGFAVRLGMAVACLLPAFVAWSLARFGEGDLPSKGLFAFVCWLLVFGVSALAEFSFMPIEFLVTHFAPQWDVDGIHWPASVFGFLSHASVYVSLILTIGATFLIPIYLRPRWAGIAPFLRRATKPAG